MLYCCGHGISSFPCISILAFVPSFSSYYNEEDNEDDINNGDEDDGKEDKDNE